MAPKRKPRCDRIYLLYKITCHIDGAHYIGLVVRGASSFRAMRCRFHQHITRALGAAKGWEVPRKWALHEHIRKHGESAFTMEFLEEVRGVKAAHFRETELMRLYKATLNTRMGRM